MTKRDIPTRKEPGASLDVKYQHIPHELKELDQWVCYRLEQRGNRQTKIPYDPVTGQGAKANDPATWRSYANAIKSLESGRYDGIGFEFAGGYAGIDLDNMITLEGIIKPEALDIIQTLDSYTEKSISGTGIHIICKGELPPGARRSGNYEMYDQGRYFTMSGDIIGEAKPIQSRSDQIAMIHEKYIQKESKAAAIADPVRIQNDLKSDNDILQLAMNSSTGQQFKALYGGDITAHNGKDTSHSGADQALMNSLIYWTNGDADQADRLFRSSGLMRPKWNRADYRGRTIQNALSGFIPYDPPVNIRASSNAENKTVIKEAASEETPEANTEIITADEAKKDTPNTVYKLQRMSTRENPRPYAAKDYLLQNFDKDIKTFKGFKKIKTGFSNLDAQIGALYPGLYVIGAISSLGKTTFIHQMGDQLAKAGEHVLYYTLEQSALEMITKSLSRITAQQNRQDLSKAKSSIAIRAGDLNADEWATVWKAAAAYEGAENMSIIPCNFNTSLEWIRESAEAYMLSNGGSKPIVIVDYLQIIPASDSRQGEREKIDHIVRGLKKLQADNNLIVFVVSSFNRSNYLTPVDYESFKESGGIEYTADVIWGLQLNIMNEDMFNSEKKIKEKREAVKAAKKAHPRKVELVCLKNRYGVSSYSCGFNYYAAYDLFEPDLKYIEPGEDEAEPTRRI